MDTPFDTTSLLRDSVDADSVLAQALQCKAAPGRWDEMRACVPSGPHTPATPQTHWHRFFEQIEDLRRTDLDGLHANIQRQIRDNGVTYNVYADNKGPQRPWSLDLLPLIVSSQEWEHITAGLQQRMRLLEHVMRDVYGPQSLVRKGLLPSALVHGHPGYLHSMAGVTPVGGVHLHVAALDLARGPDGNWWVVAQRCQAPSGLGYLLENRLAVSRQFPQAFTALKVQRLAATYTALVESLKAHSPAGAQAHIALLTPGPYNETYFEHAYLARYLGMTLVEGNDLLVRDEKLYLKTLRGLIPVHGLLRRLDDDYLDPLELRPDSTLGVPGLLQAIRAGNVLVANAPGAGFLESTALLGFLPALAQEVLNEELLLPALPTWWCGERSAMEEALPRLRELTIKPTYPSSILHPQWHTVMGPQTSAPDLQNWAARIAAEPENHTAQTFMPLSQMPIWLPGNTYQHGRMSTRSVLLRVFALSDGYDANGQAQWRVLPGGLARLTDPQDHTAAMQRGGSSADVWALTEGELDQSSRLGNPHLEQHTPKRDAITSRAAENLFWLGRYTERTENAVQLAITILECTNGEHQNNPELMQWLSELAQFNMLVPQQTPAAHIAKPVFERALIGHLNASDITGVGFNLRALRQAAANVRLRLSPEHWTAIKNMEQDFTRQCEALVQRREYSSAEALRYLNQLQHELAAVTGGQTDRMTRDDGWRLLSIGRHLERLAFLAHALQTSLHFSVPASDGGFDALLRLFDSFITFRAQYQQRRSLYPLTDLLVLDGDNPRSLSWVTRTLRARLNKMEDGFSAHDALLAQSVPDPAVWSQDLHHLLANNPTPDALTIELMELTHKLIETSYTLSDKISARYFTHIGLEHSLSS